MGRFFNIALSIFVASGSFLFGYDAGVMTDVIASQHFQDYFRTEGKTSPVIGAINSTFNGGAVFGALMGGFTMDSLGRKKTLQIGALICLVGATLQTAAVNLAMILLGRILAGWAVGLLSMAVPVYQSECAHPKIRGLIVGFAQQMIGVGFIVSTWIGYGAHHAGYSAFQWRFPLAFQTVPCIALIIGMFFLPESPRHLIATDRDDEGLRVLKKLHYNGSNNDWIEEEFNEIKQTIAAEKAITVPGWAIMFKQRQWRTRLMHGVAVQVFTQLSGINVIGYYQIIMYEALGITGSRALLVAGIYNCVGPLANLVFILFIVDRIGRRKPLLFGAAGITIALICEAAINSQNIDGKNRSMSMAGVAFLFLVSIIFSLSFGPVSWIYMSEVMPMQIRARGNAFATGIGNWLVATIFAQASPEGLGKLGWKFYFVFVAFNIVVTIPVIFLFFKETKQLSLEEVDLLFGERALGTLPDDLNKEGNVQGTVEQAETRREVEGKY